MRLLIGWLLVCGALEAAEVPSHIARGHLLAAYCSARPETKPKQVVGIYREIVPVAAPPGSYTTVAFTGGYVGLTGNKDATGGNQINFSIWGKDAAEAAPADSTYGAIKTRQFTHEGTGWAGRLAYPWKVGQRYHVFVHVRHEQGHTIYSAWFGSVEKGDWLLAGRTRKNGIHQLGNAGGFLEHAGTKDMQIRRATAYGPSWIHDGLRWLPCSKVDVSVKDPDNARFSQQGGLALIEIGLGLKSQAGSKAAYTMNVPSPALPRLPEQVALLKP